MAQTVTQVMTAEPQGQPHDDPASHAFCRHDGPRGTSPTPDPLDPRRLHFSVLARSSRSIRSEVACARRVSAIMVSVWVSRSRAFSCDSSNVVFLSMHGCTRRNRQISARRPD